MIKPLEVTTNNNVKKLPPILNKVEPENLSGFKQTKSNSINRFI
jgi:hypothetical protein